MAVGSLGLLIAATIWLWPSDLTAGAFQLNALGVFGFLASIGGLARATLPGVKLIGDGEING
ncbi:hypothetical protein [Rhizobium azibense]|uniref:Uncharacterized protein n=1 Tax=Rhizobium azibense TaxID=1136135 RepID=A0A4R3RCG0_9HYPH|nr:hypothetical protein [Rhizobium azibense]TCU33140.1 hypothetical protein EV129_117137 [Rhizobium azibense]